MKVLLIKPETVGIFSWTKMVDHEPLELEYLDTVLKKQGHVPVIYDRRFETTALRKKLRQEKPDVVCLTGYITQEKLMLRLIHAVKAFDQTIVIVVGGSHVELNYRNFYASEADYLYRMNGLRNFELLMTYIDGCRGNAAAARISLEEIHGICYVRDGTWLCRPTEVETPEDLPVPDRTHFYANEQRYRYLRFHPLALIKNAYSCPNACTFCYCTNRNLGSYRCRSVAKLVDEIASLQVQNIHITDDNFLVSRAYLQDFIALVKKRNIRKNYLVYGRAEFIAQNEDLIKALGEIGLSLVMVGLEATNDDALDAYHKHTTLEQNEACIRILHENHIICAGLFIVSQDMTKQDFKHLYHWIAKRPIIPTISVFTPMQGTASYQEYEPQLLTKDVRKQDLFHCILQPKTMHVRRFTLAYYALSWRLMFKNRKSDLYACIGLSDVWFVIKQACVKCMRLLRL